MARAAAILILAALTSLAANAQESSSFSSLSETQRLGQRVFLQRCGVCHTGSNAGRYGPVLYKDLVAGKEDKIRDFIRNGSPERMPGFKYTLEPEEINAIVEYLKTVEKPVAKSGAPE